MKVLYVFGEEYSALNFENSKLTIADGIKIAQSNCFCYSDEFYAEFRVYEFDGNVDSKFISFLKNEILDYDQLKHENFYILEEE